MGIDRITFGELQTKSDIYNIEGILPIMDGPEWTEIEEIE
jgi:hypothetical protein